MSLYGWWLGKGPSGFGYSSRAEEVCAGLDLRGKHFLITGPNSGIGLETVRVLCARGASVLAAARTRQKAAASHPTVLPLECELSEPASVRDCVAEVRSLGCRLDGIIANAGIMALPRLQVKHGLEMQFLTNHLGHFQLVTGLLDCLEEHGRVVILSSRAHRMAPRGGIEFDNLDGRRGYRPWTAYGQSKLANLLFARALARRIPQSVAAVHPGVIVTSLWRHLPPVVSWVMRLAGAAVLKSIPEGAATQCWAAVHPGAAELRGDYLVDCNLAPSTALGRDEALSERLWQKSERLLTSLL